MEKVLGKYGGQLCTSINPSMRIINNLSIVSHTAAVLLHVVKVTLLKISLCKVWIEWFKCASPPKTLISHPFQNLNLPAIDIVVAAAHVQK